MDSSITDLSYYLGKSAGDVASLDVPLSNGQIVSINLDEELPEDSEELVAFLETEKCPIKYWIIVGQAYCRKRKVDEAKKLADKASVSQAVGEKEKIQVKEFLAWIWLMKAGQSAGTKRQEYLQKASDEINVVSKVDSSSVPNLLARATLAMHMDQAERALEIFDRLLKIDGSNCFALLGKAQIVLKKTKNYQQALKLYQQVLLLNPVMQPDPRIGVGLCFWFLKDTRMAITAWERALELDHNNLKARLLLNLAKFNSTFNESQSDDEFVANYEACLREAASLHREMPSDGVILLTLISYFYSKNDFSRARKAIDQIMANYNDKSCKFEKSIYSQAITWQGRIIFAEGDFMQAQKLFHEAIKLDDSNLLAKLVLGQSQISRGSIEEAIITYESIMKTDPKCLEVIYSLGVLYSKQKGRRKHEQAIQTLERYIRLSARRDVEGSLPEPVFINALLILSRLYESKDINQSLNFLNKAIEACKMVKKDAQLEVYNNIGVIHFMKSNFETSSQYFQLAYDKLEQNSSMLEEDLFRNLTTTVQYNLARSKENASESEALELYKNILKTSPNYFSAKLRLLFLQCLGDDKTKIELKDEIEALLKESASNLEIRAFYGWFINTFGKKIGVKTDVDTQHQKDTLVKYDSHDCYALLSLANIYCIMARDIKVNNSATEEKQKKYYIRATELFAKVLSVDPKDVYAAQGLAIVYIETKDTYKGLDILRKIRDSLNDISVYSNLGHVLLDLKQYIKSIENYEIALMRFRGGKDIKLLSALGKAWYLRGVDEKNMTFLKKSLEYSEEALQASNGSKSSLEFNIAYVQFQIAEFVSKLSIDQRSVEDIQFAIMGLNEAISTLDKLTAENAPEPPYPKADIQARANLGRNTLLNRLNVCLEETNENMAKLELKLQEAKKAREEEEKALIKEEEERKEKQRQIEEELAKERVKLQEQAQQWVEEARALVDDEKDNIEVDDEYEEEGKSKKKSAKKDKANKKEKNEKKEKGGKRGKKRSKAIISDSDDASDPEPEPELEPEDDEAMNSASEGENDEKPTQKKRKVRAISDDEEDEEEMLPNEEKENDADLFGE